MMLQQVDCPFLSCLPTESAQIKGREIRNDGPGVFDHCQWLESLLKLQHFPLTIKLGSLWPVPFLTRIDVYCHHRGFVVCEGPIEGSNPGLSILYFLTLMQCLSA